LKTAETIYQESNALATPVFEIVREPWASVTIIFPSMPLCLMALRNRFLNEYFGQIQDLMLLPMTPTDSLQSLCSLPSLVLQKISMFFNHRIPRNGLLIAITVVVHFRQQQQIFIQAI
jgi:hypothetical protein